jgi:dipeptidase E
MKLYLASYRVAALDELLKLVGKPVKQVKMAIIPNAKDYYIPRVRRLKVQRLSEYFKGLGFNEPGVIDITDYPDPAKMATDLKQCDLIWVMGGNTFVLQEIMQDHGFAQVIRDVLNSGVVYGGESAGSCVAGTNLHGIELADDIEYAGRPVFKGLGLVQKAILPHCDNPEYAEVMKQINEQLKDSENVISLNDNQAYVVDGDKARIVTGYVEVVE